MTERAKGIPLAGRFGRPAPETTAGCDFDLPFGHPAPEDRAVWMPLTVR